MMKVGYIQTLTISKLQVSIPSRHRLNLPRSALDQIQPVLDESTKARKVSVQLKGMEFADQLAKELLKHSTTMEELYGELKAATNREDHGKG